MSDEAGDLHVGEISKLQYLDVAADMVGRTIRDSADDEDMRYAALALFLHRLMVRSKDRAKAEMAFRAVADEAARLSAITASEENAQ